MTVADRPTGCVRGLHRPRNRASGVPTVFMSRGFGAIAPARHIAPAVPEVGSGPGTGRQWSYRATIATEFLLFGGVAPCQGPAEITSPVACVSSTAGD